MKNNCSKKYIQLIILCFTMVLQAQEQVDIVTPQKTDFVSGNNIEGNIKNSINEATGKVKFTIPITTITSRGLTHDIVFNYDGHSAFETGKKHNKFNATGILGTGFNLLMPKIIANNKNTASKEDDEFYIQDGEYSSKVHCTRRIDPGRAEGDIIWEFRAEKYVPWKIQYFKARRVRRNGGIGIRYREITLDYWVVTNENGIKYTYGNTQNTRENLVAWGNWIGNSNKTGGQRETIIWNLSTIKNQWENSIRFEYELQESTIGGVKQTEASYLKKIITSTGENIVFTYANKGSNEYYEPHREKAEPDAYQERYEKRYLRKIAKFNSNNGLIFTYDLAYYVHNNSSGNDQKRYLARITQQDKNGASLPSQKFEYHTSGDFKGGIKKITYPMGGSVTYNYQNKYLFTNTANRYTGSAPNNSDYYYYSIATRDNYTLMLLKSKQPVSGKHRFKVVRNWWNGQNWKRNSYILPYTIKDTHPNSGAWLENFQAVFGKDFYAFAYKDGNRVKLDLFHLKRTGVSWHHETQNIHVGGGNPSLMAGDNFIALGEHHDGGIHTYRWTEKGWGKGYINQGPGQYYYGATNNFILSLDEDGGTDMITGVSHEDNYYMHYLGIDNRWSTRSWSATADPHIAGIEKPSFFYPENSMAGFVADDNPELFLRWSKNYNLITPDNVLGAVNDRNPLISTYTGMYTLQNWFYQNPIKFARFNGLNWKISSPPSSATYYASPSYGEDIMTFQNQGRSKNVGYTQYDPNTDSWFSNAALNSYPWYVSNDKQTGITKDFLVAGNKIYKISNTTRTPLYNQTLQYNNVFAHTDGLSHAFVKLASHNVNGSAASEVFQKGMFFYTNQNTNQIASIDLGKKYQLSGPVNFAGRTPFISPRSLWLRNQGTSSSFSDYLYRLIDDKVNNQIRDIVVSEILINDGFGETRKTKYTYSSPNSSPTNDITFYGKVIVENKGYGTASIGKVEKTFNNGSTDQQMAGLLLEEKVKTSGNGIIKLTTNTWTKNELITPTYNTKLTRKEEKIYYGGRPVTNITENTFNPPYFLPTKTFDKNSKGQTLQTTTNHAIGYYSFMEHENFLALPYEVNTKIDDKITSIQRTIWKKDGNGKIYSSEVWSGNSSSDLRLTYQVTKMSTHGHVIESNNGRGLNRSILYGYNYRYPIALITNAKFNDVISNLDVSLDALQNMNNQSIKAELLKLHNRLPEAIIEINLYDIEGKIREKINSRQESMKYYYDSFNRLDYTTDYDNKVINKNLYHYKTE